jgi:Concanavalin A-like lectin/glucanases superfamily/VanZ like family
MGLLYGLILLSLLLYPFNFHFPSRLPGAEKLPQCPGVELSSLGGIRSKSSTKLLYSRLISSTGLTVEVWIETKNVSQKGPARIVSYSLNKGLRNFTLGQDKQDLEFRLRTRLNDLNGAHPSVRCKKLFRAGVAQHLAVTYDYAREKVFLDGQKVHEESLPGGDFSNWNASYPLMLGNEATGNRPWSGKIFLVAIYNRALSAAEILQNYRAGRFLDDVSEIKTPRIMDGLVALYPFESTSEGLIRNWSTLGPALNLEIVTEAQIWKGSFLARSGPLLPWGSGISDDFVVNVLAFIPLGFLSFLAIRGLCSSWLKCGLFVLASGLSLSLFAESLQYFSPNRTSSLNDVINNGVGTALGVAVAGLYSRLVPFQKGRL